MNKFGVYCFNFSWIIKGNFDFLVKRIENDYSHSMVDLTLV